MQECERKEFKLAINDKVETGNALSWGHIFGLTATLFIICFLVAIVWAWGIKPWIRHRFLNPKFLGHYHMFPTDGCIVDLKKLDMKTKPTPEHLHAKQAKNLTLSASNDPYMGSPFEPSTEPTSPLNYDLDNGMHDIVSEKEVCSCDVIPAMVPLVDSSNIPVMVPEVPQGNEIFSTVIDSLLENEYSGNIVGIHRHNGMVHLYIPSTEVMWNRYGQTQQPTEQTVAVFQFDTMKWWYPYFL